MSFAYSLTALLGILQLKFECLSIFIYLSYESLYGCGSTDAPKGPEEEESRSVPLGMDESSDSSPGLLGHHPKLGEAVGSGGFLLDLVKSRSLSSAFGLCCQSWRWTMKFFGGIWLGQFSYCLRVSVLQERIGFPWESLGSCLLAFSVSSSL
jgi:hypothetical protein